MKTREYNYYDEKTNLKFYRVIKEGKTKYSRQYKVGGKRTWTPLLSTPSKVIKFIEEQRKLNEENPILVKTKHTFRRVVKMWYDDTVDYYKSEGRSSKTISNHMSFLNNYVLKKDLPYKSIADEYVEMLTINDIKKFKRELVNYCSGKLKYGSLRALMASINVVLFYSSDNGFSDITLARDTSVNLRYHSSKSSSKRNFLSEKEFDILLDTYDRNAYKYFKSRNSRKKLEVNPNKDKKIEFRVFLYKAIFTFMFYTGFRTGETRGTRWCDLLSPNEFIPLHRVKVDNQYNEPSIIGFESDKCLKTRSSERVCYLNKKAVESLMDLKNFLVENNMYEDNNYMFLDIYNRNKKPICRPTLYLTLRDFIDMTDIESQSLKSGQEKKINLHGFRHSSCSNLLEKGMRKEDVAKFLGHSNLKMVELVYSHFFGPENMEEKALNKNINYFL